MQNEDNEYQEELDGLEDHFNFLTSILKNLPIDSYEYERTWDDRVKIKQKLLELTNKNVNASRVT